MVLPSRLFLILTLIAGSTLMAPMRGHMAGLSQIEVCSDAGIRTVTVDAHGNPVAIVHSCPDCVTCVATGPLPDAGGVHVARTAVAAALPHVWTRMATGLRAVQPTARGPPWLV